jgi:hypothetical protein
MWAISQILETDDIIAKIKICNFNGIFFSVNSSPAGLLSAGPQSKYPTTKSEVHGMLLNWTETNHCPNSKIVEWSWDIPIRTLL